ncbi:MAG: hypothetical protein ACJLTB_11305 [Algoriphagus aquaeductus]|uniref:hypothetical protein n=1 Tax=Algoriphagus aquaeductus TaxID=475299 RepID=UPI00387A39EF
MSIHRGQKLREELEKYMGISGKSLSAIAKKAGYDQSTPYRHFERADLPLFIISRYAKAIDYDFSMAFPELLDLGISAVKKANATIQIEINEAQKWKDKYFDLLEKYTALLEERLGS